MSVEENRTNFMFISPGKYKNSAMLQSHILSSRKLNEREFRTNFSQPDMTKILNLRKQTVQSSARRLNNSQGLVKEKNDNILSLEINVDSDRKYNIGKDLNYQCIEGRGNVNVIDEKDLELISKLGSSNDSYMHVNQALSKM